MQLLSGRAAAAIDRLVKFAFGDQALVTDALARHARGEISDSDIVDYIRRHRDEARRPKSLPEGAATPC
jgi:hypothetical protein